ncbi:MAG: hypothetical protein K0S76_202 [Herbinix sp.]|nr:hypothetical protein [Herbinix sp.]
MIEKIENGKEKAIGKLKENVGQIMEDNELEFRGKMQSMKADVSDTLDNGKETVLRKTNDIIDKAKEYTKDMKNMNSIKKE